MSKEIEGFRLSPQQEGLWAVSHERAWTQCVVAIAGELHAPALLAVTKQVAGKHSALSTCFRRLPGLRVPIQIVDEHISLVWNDHDLSGQTFQEQERQLADIAYQDRSLPFDLEQGPLLRISLVSLTHLRHSLVLTVPSLCADAQTLANLVREIHMLYHGHPTGDEQNEVTQYLQFSEWLRELQEEEDAACRSCWEDFQTARSSRVVLPYERVSSLTKVFEPAYITRVQPAEEIRSFAQRYQQSSSHVLLTCWFLLLWKLSERPDITLDVVFNGRTFEELQNACGFFAKTLPLHASLPDNLSFIAAMIRLQDLLSVLSERQDYYLGDIHADRHLEQGAVISFEFNEGFSTQPGTELLFSIEKTFHWFHRFKINVQVLHCRETFFLQFAYDPTVFTATDIECLADQFNALLTHALRAPESAVSQLSLLDDAGRLYLLDVLNRTSTDYPREACFHQLFEMTVERLPEAIAVRAADQSITYRELNAQANQLAITLQRAGVRPDTLVGISMDRSGEMLVALLGILKAGGAFVPLDSSYPQHRLETMCQDAGISVIVTGRAGQRPSFASGERVISLDSSIPCDVAAFEQNPVSGAVSENLAYVVYTSGSTGRPKGTMISHRGLVNYVHWAGKTYAAHGTGAPLHTPVSFDLTITSLFVPFLVGKSVLICPQGQDLEELSRLFNSEQDFSFIKLTPAHLEALGHLQRAEGTAHRARTFIIGGEALKEKHLSFWRTCFPDARLFNEYGPTETVVGCCVYEIPAVHFPHGNIPIGRPIANTRMYILDHSLQPMAIGLPGEISIGGDGLARGYLQRPDLTAECFVPDPFSTTPGARLYKTGDIARWRPEGLIEFLGRKDAQVKIRGYRIELGEIEHQLREHPAVQDAVVLALDGSDGQKRLSAYVLYQEGILPDTTILHRFLQKRLPGYMLPGTFLAVQSWPLTSNGKIDDQALSQLKTATESPGVAFVAPGTEAERILAEACCELLHLERMGIYENFFEKGGDSILAIQLVARVRQAGLYLVPRQLFEYQTIAELAPVATTTAVAEAEQGTVLGPVPLTPIQQWFFERHFQNPQHWNQALLLEVQPFVRPEWLEEALLSLLSHHDALRLAFSCHQQVWSQCHTENASGFKLQLVDLTDRPLAEQIRALQSVATELQQAFKLAESPLFQAALFSLGPQQPARLLLIAHHLVVDGVSWRILLEDFHTALAQLERGEKIVLPAKTTSYQYWAEKLLGYVRSGALHHQLFYWLNATQTVAPLPCDYAQGVNTEASAHTIAGALSPEETRQLLQELPGTYHTEINEVLLTALVEACAPWTGQRQLLITLEGHGREEFFEDVDLSRTVGWFTSLFPVVLEKAEEGSVLESLKRVKTTLRELPQRGSGYGLLRYLLEDPVVQQAIQALPQAELSFNYLGQTDQVFARSRFFAPAEEEIGAGRAASNLRETLLDVTAIVNAGKLQVLWTYSKHIHSPATIEALAGRYIHVLQELLAAAALPHVPTVTDFPLAELEPATFEHLLQKQRQIEDIYPLAPAQHEMLRASLASPGSWAYFNQFSCQLHGTVNVAALQRACQRVVDRHTVLRTSFVWEGFPRALQVVHRQSVLPFDVHDWQSLSPEEQQSRWIAYKNADRARGFDLETAPLVRLTLIRVAHDVSYFIWSHHHLLMDGWCMSPLLQEVFHTYRSFCQGQDSQREPAPPYRDYIAWLQRQDSMRAEQFWQQTLQGLDRPTLLASSSPAQISPADQCYEERDVQLPARVTKNLHAFTRRYHLTANTVFQGAWALTLSQFTGQSDLIFGATIADRPADLRDVEARIGLFINTLPVRIQVPSSSRLLSWLQQIQEQQALLRQYAHSSLTDIHTWCSWTPGQPLFQCFLRFQNYPKDLTLEQQPDDFAIEAVSSIDRWQYPLGLVVNLAQECRLEISYQRDFFPDSLTGQILAQLEQFLTLIVESPEQHIADLLAGCPRP